MTTLNNTYKGFEDRLIDLQNNMLNFALTLTSNREEAKDLLQETEIKIAEVEEQKRKSLEDFGLQNDLAKQLVDLALLANNMLRGEALSNFVKRSVELMK